MIRRSALSRSLLPLIECQLKSLVRSIARFGLRLISDADCIYGVGPSSLGRLKTRSELIDILQSTQRRSLKLSI